MSKNPLERAREDADAGARSAQDRNRMWWERLPMTYADWGDSDRDIRSKHGFEQARNVFLDSNPWLKEHFDFGKGKEKSVLEVGCGSGVAACLFAAAGAKVTAVDITQKAVELTRANAQFCGVQIEALQMDAERMTFSDASFDYVFSWGVLHHSENPSKAFREVARVLKPNGEGLIMVYNKASLRYYVKGLYWLIAKRRILSGETLDDVQRHYTDGYYQKHYLPSELRAELESFGLRVRKVSVTHMAKQMIPAVPRSVDDFLKSTLGWLLVMEFDRQGTRSPA